MKQQLLSLKQKYEQKIITQLQQEFGIKNKMAVPKIIKVIVNMGTGEKLRNKELKEVLMKDLAAITGQKPSIRPAKISVAGFSLREGMPVGLKVTLRKERMYDFLQKLFFIVMPRKRDFRGVSLKSFDEQANYTLGFPEYTVFPEVGSSKISGTQGLEVTIVTNTQNVKESKRLLELLGMPFEKEE